jgi:hypothetical protein
MSNLGARRGRTTVLVDTPAATTSAHNVTKLLQDAVTAQLSNEWAMGVENVILIEKNAATGKSYYEVEFIAIPGSGPTDSTAPEGLSAYREARGNKDFDNPAPQ